VLQEEELCQFGSTGSRASIDGLGRTPGDAHRPELVLQVGNRSDPVLNRGCGHLRRAGMLQPPCSAAAFPCVGRPQPQLCPRKKAMETSQPAPAGTLILSPASKRRRIFGVFLAFKHSIYNSWSYLSCNQLFKQKGMFYMDFSTTLNSVRVMCVCSLLPLKAGALCHDNVRTTWQTHTHT